MKVIQSGDVYNLYGSEVMTYDRLPPKTYTVEFDVHSGCYLKERTNIESNEKAYGEQTNKVEKVMSAFERIDRSLGIILSGDKGIGKTMFAKRLCERCIELGIPVVLVDEGFPRISQFIEKIDQECLVLFDEFEKMFSTCDDEYEDDSEDEQSKLLSLFDGTSSTKKLCVVTCNNLNCPFILHNFV